MRKEEQEDFCNAVWAGDKGTFDLVLNSKYFI